MSSRPEVALATEGAGLDSRISLVQEKSYFVYIMSNESWRPFYTGVTSELPQRVWQHQQHEPGSYTAQYNIDRLFYYERYQNVFHAIARGKTLKRYTRAKKLALIRKINPHGDDLSRDWGTQFKPPKTKT